MSRFFLFLLLALGVGGAVGVVVYRQHRTQQQLNGQLQELSGLLMADNDDADLGAKEAMKSIQAVVAKSHNLPRELAVLAAAKTLDHRADSMASTLHTRSEDLLRATGNLTDSPALPHPNETRAVAELLGIHTPANDKLHQQLASYEAALHVLHPKAAFRLSAPAFGGLTVVEALATCAQLESEVRAAEAEVLRHLALQVGTTLLTPHQVALVSAESNTVAPGEKYRARLLLVNALGPLPASIQMRCNGQPVPVGADMMGRVRFVAPQRPGPASWTGTIRFQVSGRDTIFQVRVPYRVARR